MKIQIERAQDRGTFDFGWLETFHSFSFGNYYNLKRMHFGALRVFNDDTVMPQKGFESHSHKDMEIVTIPLSGSLRHSDSEANEAVIESGEIQVMRAGKGIEHSEFNNSNLHLLRFLQIWIYPRRKGKAPFYASYNISKLIKPNQISTFIAPEGPIWLDQEVWFSLGQFKQPNEYPYKFHRKDTGLFLFIIKGSIEINDINLNMGDTIQITETDRVVLTVLQSADVLLIEVTLDFEN